MAGFSLWKILLGIGILFSLVAFILGWIGFSVPDWQQFQRYNNTILEYYGLWAYCQDQSPQYNSVCQRWPTAENQLFNGSRPSFVRTSEGLITTGMILLSLGLCIAIITAILPLLAYLAAGLAFIAFLFLVIGVPIFGRESNSFSRLRGDSTYSKLYGFWLMVPTIIFEFLAALLFLGAGILYKASGYGNIASGFGNKSSGNFGNRPYGGQRMLGPANMFTGPPYGNMPYGMRPPGLFGTGGGMPSGPYPYGEFRGQTEPSLLSQYLTDNVTPIYVRRTVAAGTGILPQPSMVPASGGIPLQNVTPAYYRFGEPYGPRFTPIINLSGQTIVGPVQRIS